MKELSGCATRAAALVVIALSSYPVVSARAVGFQSSSRLRPGAKAPVLPVLPASGSSLPIYGFDIRTYGAIGDGTTDCTTAFQSAFDSCVAAGRCRLPCSVVAIACLILPVLRCCALPPIGNVLLSLHLQVEALSSYLLVSSW